MQYDKLLKKIEVINNQLEYKNSLGTVKAKPEYARNQNGDLVVCCSITVEEKTSLTSSTLRAIADWLEGLNK